MAATVIEQHPNKITLLPDSLSNFLSCSWVLARILRFMTDLAVGGSKEHRLWTEIVFLVRGDLGFTNPPMGDTITDLNKS